MKQAKRVALGILLALLALALTASILLTGSRFLSLSAQTEPSQAQISTTQAPSTVPSTAPSTEVTQTPTTEPTEPAVTKIATATVGATGDLLMHDNVIKSGYDAGTGTYDFNYIFQYLTGYISQVDYAVANLEVTLCGDENGYAYSGYPQFNCPDAIVDAAKNAGFDLLLTANNHSYDTRSVGFHRTQEVIRERLLDYIGTRESVEDANYIIREINGISIGMTCYTYNTGTDSDGSVSLNGIPLTLENSMLINTFSYDDLTAFYDQLGGEIEQMYAEGAEAIVVFIHWGDEYQTSPNSYEKKIAQQLCEMGVDVIVGGHPHVIQPMATLTSEADPSHTTVCLYSMGNCVSNIRLSSTRPAECEDGLFFTFTFAKYSDGSVVVESTDILPFYVNRYTSDDRYLFPLIPLDGDSAEWQSAYSLTDSQLSDCLASLARTETILGDTLTEANAVLAQQQAALEAMLGVE
ncbi:MAG: CapA family protein [Firmicutes bacterium]|nr:CapA family protein [Bacillota bacterium]